MTETRPAAAADARAIATVYVTARRAAYARFFPAAYLAAMSIDDYEAAWRARLAADEPEITTLVAVEAGAVRAFTRFGVARERRGSRSAEVEFVYVTLERRRSGLGAALLAFAEETMAASGLEDAFLWVYAANDGARRFYEARGWSFDGGRDVVDRGGAQIERLRYRKRL